nr:hypothetical protein [Clostridia bacterium]
MEYTVDKKAIMYAIIRALEADFVRIFASALNLADIPEAVKQKSNRVKSEANEALSYLMGLDIQAYIEICNANVAKLNITLDQRRFLNNELNKAIPIRNRVMHPRPLEITDNAVLQTLAEEVISLFSQFDWIELRKALYIIQNNPSSLQIPSYAQKSKTIIENLPDVPDFEETCFIGRRKEIGDIKAKLFKNNVHVLSIIGDGGVGKTALAIKLLYDLLDDPNCKFELILWTTLKTSQLSGYEFKHIDDAIATTAQMYEKLGEFVGEESHQDIPSYLIDLAQEFNTLLVLDNLETVNTEDVKAFIDEFTEYGKVLITSRIGLGEMEHRYALEGLNETDVIEYMDALLELHGFSGLFTNERKLDIAQKQLHSNPLAIKWFVKGVHSGRSVDDVLANKDDLVKFCMSNVYDKLSQDARNILETIQILKMDLSVGELMFYNDATAEEYAQISLAINELIKCNFLDATKYRTQKLLSITQFASEFLQSQIIPNRERIISLRERNKEFAVYRQQLEQKKSSLPNANDTFRFYGNDNDRIVATYYLTEAIKALNAKKNTDEILRKTAIAQRIAPDYSECAAVIGLCYAYGSPEKAMLEFDKALDYSKDDEEKAAIHARYARFLRSNNMYQEAIDHLEEAVSLDSNEYIFKFELIMSYCWVNNFNKARSIFSGIQRDQLSEAMQHEYSMRYADMRRREAEGIAQSNSPRAFEFLKDGFSTLEADASQDKRKYDLMANILCAMGYLYIDDTIVDYMVEKLDAYYPQMRTTNKYKKFKDVMAGKLSIVSNEQQAILTKYLLEADAILSLLKNKQGVVIVVKENYGLFRVRQSEQSVYFSFVPGTSSFDIGDIVSYEKITTGAKGLVATNVKREGDIAKIIGKRIE